MEKKIYLLAALLLISIGAATAQVKVKDGTVTGSPSLPVSGAVLELESTNKGFLPSRVTLTNRLTWSPMTGTPTKGMIVYNTALGTNGLDTGLVVWEGSWNPLSNASQADYWRLKGNAGTTPPTAIGSSIGTANYWGTTDAQNLAIGTNGIARMIFDISGNAYGGTNGSAVSPATNNGGNNRNFVWGRNNRVSDSSNLGNTNANAVFGANNTVIAGGSLYGSTNLIGGSNNIAATSASGIFGDNNTDSALYTVIGGHYNIIAPTSGESIVVGGGSTPGEGNYLSGNGSAVFGTRNKDSADYTIVSGLGNLLSPSATASAVFGIVNTVTGAHSLVSGSSNAVYGNENIVSGTSDTVYGYRNIVNGTFNKLKSTVLSTENVVGGSNNVVSDARNFVGGGLNVVIAHDVAVFGYNNKDSANYSLAAGLSNKILSGAQYGVVLGSGNTVGHSGSMVIGSNAATTKANQLVANFTGGVVLAQLPVYATDSAADTDATLPSGSLYKLTGSRAVYQKP